MKARDLSFHHTLILFATLGIVSVGCAGSSLFSTYPSRLEPIRSQVTAGDMVAPVEKLNGILESDSVADRVLYLQERGRVLQFVGDAEESKASFTEAIEILKEKSRKALVTASGTASQGISILTNDNAIPYSPPPYESTFLRALQGMNYTLLGDREAASVEAVNLADMQDDIRKAHAREYAELEKDLSETDENGQVKRESRDAQQTVAAFDAIPQLAAVRGDMTSEVADVKSGYQNAYAHFVSGLVFQRLGYLGEQSALLEYSRALELAPDNPYLAHATFRLQASTGERKPYLDTYVKNHGKPKVTKRAAGTGTVVVIVEQGFVEPKSQIKIPVPVSGKIYTVALPYYKKQSLEPVPSTVLLTDPKSGEDTELGQTALLTETRKLAVKSLLEDYKAILVRQALRLVAKHYIQQAANEASPYAGLALGIVDAIVTNADMRSWMTLPANVQIAIFDLPAGSHALKIKENDEQIIEQSVTVRADDTTVVRVLELPGITTLTQVAN